MTRVLHACRWAIPLVLCGVIAALVWPSSLGGATSYVKVSGESMLPKLRDGDLVVARSVGRYQPGDVIAYRVPEGEVGAGLLVLHRIVGGSAATGFVTRGDNRGVDDPWRPKATDVIGEKWVVVPGVGRALGSLRSPLFLAGFAALLAVVGASGLVRRAPRASTDAEVETILVVDDESAFRRSVARMLTDSGYHVREAGGGREALDAVADGLRPVLVLTDVVMPDISGHELSIQLGEEGIHRTVLMSGRDAGTDPDRFLRKPFREHELLDLVRRELDHGAETPVPG